MTLVKRVISSQYEIVVTREDLLQMIADQKEVFGMPTDASVTVHIPGGGDHSNQVMDLGDLPITIRWTTREES